MTAGRAMHRTMAGTTTTDETKTHTRGAVL